MISLVAAIAGAVLIAGICLAVGRMSAAWGATANAVTSAGGGSAATGHDLIPSIMVDAGPKAGEPGRVPARMHNLRTGSTSFFEPDEKVEEIKAANRKLQERLAEAEAELRRKLAETDAALAKKNVDPVTHLPDRRAFDEKLAECCVAHADGADDGSVILMEIDRLRQILDHHGDTAGEFVLSRLAGVVRDTIGSEGFAARYGKEEFGVILPRVSVKRSKIIAERIRRNCDVAHDFAGTAIATSVSVGLTNCGESPELTLAGVDRALAAAKQAGCNRTFLCDGIEISPVEIAALTTSDGLDKVPTTPEEREWFDRRGWSRKEFEATQWLAPCEPGRPIRRESFREVQCRDISAGGFSFILDEAPEFSEVIVALGTPPNVTYVRAKIMHVEKGSPTTGTFLIGCRFAERLAKAADPVKPR
jgi:diguanylate cyclase (GGDEF)-like protein